MLCVAAPTRHAMRGLDRYSIAMNNGRCLEAFAESREMAGRHLIEQRVRFYRLHFIDRATGTISRTYEFHAENDLAAETYAEVWSEHAPMELWGSKACLKRWDEPSSN